LPHRQARRLSETGQIRCGVEEFGLVPRKRLMTVSVSIKANKSMLLPHIGDQISSRVVGDGPGVTALRSPSMWKQRQERRQDLRSPPKWGCCYPL
jgi:hypothetical protein